MLTIMGREIPSLNEAADLVGEVRASLLFELEDSGDGHRLNRFAEQHFLAAVSQLDVAVRHLKLAWMEQLGNR